MKQILLYYPTLIVISAIIWPDMMLRIPSRSFPVIEVLGFSVRLTEISLFILIVIYLLSYLSIKPSKYKHQITKKSLNRYVVFIGIVLIIALIQGLVFGNVSKLLNEIRIISYILFVPLFVFFVPSANKLNIPIKLVHTFLFILSILNVLSLWFYISKGYNNTTSVVTLLSLYMLSLNISYLVLVPRHKIIISIITMISLFSSVALLHKWAILGVLVIFSTIFFMVKNSKKRYKILILLVIIVLFIFGIYKDYKEKFYQMTGKTYIEYYHNRILREDVGDFSGGRFSMWSSSFSNALRNPIIGNGMGYEFSAYSRIHGYNISIIEHNIVIWLLNRFGLISTILMLIGIGKYVRWIFSLYKRETNLRYRLYLLASSAYILAFLAMNLVGNWIFVFEPAIIFYFCISVTIVIGKRQRSVCDKKVGTSERFVLT